MAPAMKTVMKAKAMKKPVMKAKVMKAKAKPMKRVSKIGKRRSVFSGKKEKTTGGLTASGLKKNKNGKIVSKAASDAAKKRNGYKAILKWSQCVKKARSDMKIKGMCIVGGKTREGQALLAKVRSLYRKAKGA